MVAQRTRLAREEQKKAAEAYHAKAATAAPEPAPTTEGESPKSGGLFGISTNQWIGIGGIGVSLLGIYYKREELKAMAKSAFDKLKRPEPTPEPAPEPSGALPRAPGLGGGTPPAIVEPEPARATRSRGLRKML